MNELSFDEALELIRAKDPRYAAEAYHFVREALDYTQKDMAKETSGSVRHVTGQELLAGIRAFALTQFGPMAMLVLAEWGVHSCTDFGEIVFNMVETGTSPALDAADIKDVPALAARLSRQSRPVSAFLWTHLSETLRQELLTRPETPGAKKRLLLELNQLLQNCQFYDEARFAGVTLSGHAKALAGRPLEGQKLAQFNRLLLEETYPHEIAKSRGLLAKTENDSRADFIAGYDFYDAFRKPFLPPSKRPQSETAPSTPDFEL